MPWLLFPLAFAAGILSTIQSGSNATLNRALEQPVAAALVVYAVGTLTALAASPFLGLSFAGLGQRAAGLPWWAWIGGVAGSLYVLATLTLAGRMGAGAFTATTLTAAVLSSVALDHFGLLGFEQREAGCALMIGGVLLVALA